MKRNNPVVPKDAESEIPKVRRGLRTSRSDSCINAVYSADRKTNSQDELRQRVARSPSFYSGIFRNLEFFKPTTQSSHHDPTTISHKDVAPEKENLVMPIFCREATRKRNNMPGKTQSGHSYPYKRVKQELEIHNISCSSQTHGGCVPDGSSVIEENAPGKTQGYDRCASSEDESEEERMSLVSCYKFSNKPIGFGAFGTCVYKGVNTKDGREVAIKKINCHTQKQTRQYKHEVKYLLLLSGCPNIVKYLDVQVEQNAVYIMLELMEGTLETLVNRRNIKIKFTELCQDISRALQFLHSRNIIHRDIKPRNILFVSSPRLMLKLADFGLSKMLDSDSSSIGYNGGTRCWMAPEVHQSLDQFSTASDIFAAGLVLHYLITSKNPFAPEGVTCNKENRLLVEHKTVDNILNQNLNAVSCLSPEALHLIRQMVRHDKNQRPNADKVLAHPFFWSNQKKMKFLQAIANQPGVYEPSLSDFKKDLEMTESSAQFLTVPWSEKSRAMKYLYDEMMTSKKRKYNTSSVADLLRFMRNAIQHVSESGRTLLFQKFILQDFIFLKEFKSLFIEVYEVVLAHDWDQIKLEIMNEMGS